MGEPNSSAGSRRTTDTARKSELHHLFELSMRMFSCREEKDILSLAMPAVSTVGAYQAATAYLLRDQALLEMTPGDAPPHIGAELTALDGADGPVSIPGAAWTRAIALRRFDGLIGYLVVTGAEEPGSHDRFLLEALTQLTAVALANITLLRAERAHALQLSQLSVELAVMNQRLNGTIIDLHQRQRIHDVFTRIVASDRGEDEIASALRRLTGHAIAVEDRFGNLLAWAGPSKPEPHPRADREEALRHAAARNGVARDRDRLIALAQPRHEIFGVVALLNPGSPADPLAVDALEFAAMALALRLTHKRNLAEVELRLRRDLVEDLIAGAEDKSVLSRSEAVGHDLRGPHYALILQWRGSHGDDSLATATARAAKRVNMSILLARRPEMVVLFARGRPDNRFHQTVADEMRDGRGSIGVGGAADSPEDFARSYHEALHSLRIRQQSHLGDGVTYFDELGMYRILGQGDGGDMDTFVREWLGHLLNYDRKHHSELVRTLSQYLECGGNYNATARALVIHRSTLRYRLRRIREISGIELNDVDNWLNLHVATRAWRLFDIAK